MRFRSFLASTLLLAACGGSGDESSGQFAAPADPRPASTIRMAELLDNLAAEVNEATAIYRNDEYVALLEASRPRFGMAMIEHANKLAVQLLRAGRTEDAIAQIDRLAEILESAGSGSEKNRRTLQRLRGLAYLRLGEQENCLIRHTIESCLLPIAGEGVHRIERGSRSAIEVYTELLGAEPDNLSFRWLLNLAYQTLGEYPDGVPERYRIPPDVYDGEAVTRRLRDAAPAAGLSHTALSGGVAMDDFNGDGLLDIVTSSWGVHDPLKFFSARGDGTFEDRTTAALLEGLNGGLNLNHADYDNDGDLDLYVMRGAWLGSFGEYPNSLLRNNGDGTFEDVTAAAGMLRLNPSPTAAWGDYDNDGWLDLFVANESRARPRPCELWHNNGDGTFTDVAADVGLDHTGFVKGSVWGDYDNDGLPDLYLSRIGDTNLLFHNDGPAAENGWGFSEVGERAGVTLPIKSFPTWFFDYDNDGWLDLMVATFAEFDGSALHQVVADYLGLPVEAERSKLYRNRGDGTFEDVSVRTGVDRVLLAMGSNFGDIDNDGWLDVYIGTGEPALGTLVPNVMLRNEAGKRFVDVTASAGMGTVQKGHGIAFGDIDNDGDEDVYAVMGGAYSGDIYQNILFENPSDAHWVTLRLIGTQSNRSGVGARIKVTVRSATGEVREIHRVVGTGGSFGSSSLQQEIGLGRAAGIESIEVFWPASGQTDRLVGPPMDAVLRVTEGRGTFDVVPSEPIRLGK